MSIDISTWRTRIGSFIGGSHQSPHYQPMSGVVESTSPVNIHIPLLLFTVLLLIGGLELNPGPPKKPTSSTSSNFVTEEEFFELGKNFVSLQSAFTKLQWKVDFLEIQSKRNNIIIYGMEEPSSEPLNKPLTEEICEKLSEKLGLDISKDDLDSAPHLG